MPDPENRAIRIEYKTAGLFGPLVSGRDCGGCTICCVHTKIDTPELQKDAGAACPHCTSTGCGIYADRFQVCRIWHCLWRHISEMPDEARPDRLGVMFGLAQPAQPENVFKSCYIHALAFDGIDAAKSELAQAVYEMLAQGDVPLWVSTHDSELELLHPDNEIATAVLEPDRKHTRKIRREAVAWRSGLRQKAKAGFRHFWQEIRAR